ncbi:MAG: hypothetical protein JAY64_05010, partial [Candidatus Thiodiazotropha weberae]|nr:hypothetical protein [Candidatus Thiodiazotropha lotti]MCW4210509.1 hypothetical protein [Candidatus Thiodiazotropha lotti]
MPNRWREPLSSPLAGEGPGERGSIRQHAHQSKQYPIQGLLGKCNLHFNYINRLMLTLSPTP